METSLASQDYASPPSYLTERRVVRSRVEARDVSTQFPSAIEDILGGPRQKVLFAKRRADIPDLVLDRLLFLQEKLKKYRAEVDDASRWLLLPDLPPARRNYFKVLKRDLEFKLRQAEDDFWHINCPDPEERTQRRLSAYLKRQERLERGAQPRAGSSLERPPVRSHSLSVDPPPSIDLAVGPAYSRSDPGPRPQVWIDLSDLSEDPFEGPEG